MKRLKKNLIIFGGIILAVVIALLIQRVIFNGLNVKNTDEAVENLTNTVVAKDNETGNEEDNVTAPELIDDGKTLVVPAYSDKITTNSLWCGSFALVWNDLMSKEGAKEIKFAPQEKSAQNLNKQEFTKDSISEKDYYKTYGVPTVALKEKIEKAIKDKFNEKSDILDGMKWYKNEKDAKNAYLFYAMLKKAFTFKYEFDELGKDNFEGDKYKNIKYFGVNNDSDEKLKDQIRVLYYNSDEDFAVELSTIENERLIVCNNPEGDSFKQIYENLDKKAKAFTGIRILEDLDEFKMPELNIDVMKNFSQFEGRDYYDENGDLKGTIDKAVQTIKLKLDKKGGTLKSEAGIMVNATSARPENKKPRKLYVDDSFAMFLVEDGKNIPYYGSMITDITLFQK